MNCRELRRLSAQRSIAQRDISEVRISGIQDAAIQWSGSGSITNSIIDHCGAGIITYNAAVDAALTIENCTIDHSGVNGVQVGGVSSFPVFLVSGSGPLAFGLVAFGIGLLLHDRTRDTTVLRYRRITRSRSRPTAGCPCSPGSSSRRSAWPAA